MPNFVLVDGPLVVSLRQIYAVEVNPGNSSVLLVFTASSGTCTITCSSAADATAALARLTHYFDPKA